MTWTIAPAPVDGGAATTAIRTYLADIITRYHGRPATAAEIDEMLAEEPGEGMAPPNGVFLLARAADEADEAESVGGCAGVQLLSPKVAELKRLWVHPDARGQGLADRLMEASEQAALRLGATTIRLDTRGDLIEARRLYARHGYAEIAPYNDNPYADHFFEKRLD